LGTCKTNGTADAPTAPQCRLTAGAWVPQTAERLRTDGAVQRMT
jgi:hypothetical protein